LAACTKGALTAVVATAAAPSPAFLIKSRLFIRHASFRVVGLTFKQIDKDITT
jgi:hypothetical protein